MCSRTNSFNFILAVHKCDKRTLDLQQRGLLEKLLFFAALEYNLDMAYNDKSWKGICPINARTCFFFCTNKTTHRQFPSIKKEQESCKIL